MGKEVDLPLHAQLYTCACHQPQLYPSGTHAHHHILPFGSNNGSSYKEQTNGGNSRGVIILYEGYEAVCLLEDHCGKGNLGCPVATFFFGI